MIECPAHEHDIEIQTGEDALGRRIAVRVCRRCGATCGTLELRPGLGDPLPPGAFIHDPLTDALNRTYAERQGWKR